MQIGIDASRVAVEARTGTEHYTYELLGALARRDRHNRYTLYCNRLPARLPPLGPNMALRAIPLGRLWTHARLSAELLAHPPDVLFVPAHVVPLGTPLARRTHTVVTIHDLGYLHFPEAHTRAQRLYLRLSTVWSARVAQRVIAISGATRDDLVAEARVPASKIRVIHHGVAPHFRPVEDPAALATVQAHYGIAGPYVLYVGTVQPRKNLVRLIEAFAAVAGEAAPTTQLVIAGKRGWLTEAIERRAAELGLAERVRFTGYVADADLPALISGAQVFALPSLYEGFGMPVLEAMACGTPVLAANSSALPEVAGDAALLADPTSVPAISAALARLLAEPGLRAALRERGLRRAGEFTWERCAEETLKTLQG
ncbi:MAG: glycosyltransferase family 1 protein [Roseiflexaceae bacterium]